MIDINNVEKLDKYLDNTFATVSISDKGDYSISIKRKCLGGMFGGDDKDKLYNSWSIPSQVNVSTPYGSIKMDTNMYTSVPNMITGGVTFDTQSMERDAFYAASVRSADERFKEMQKNTEVLNNNCYGIIDYSPFQQTGNLEVKIADSFLSSVGQGASIGAGVGMFTRGLHGAGIGAITGAAEGVLSSFIFGSSYKLSDDSIFKKWY